MLEALAALAKLLLYAGTLAGAGTAFAAASLGGSLAQATPVAPPIMRIGAALAALGAVAHVVILVLRLGGEFSEPVLLAILDSPTGAALALQLLGAAVVLVFASARGLRNYACVLGGILIIQSFGVNGHAGSLNFTSGAIAALHVGAAGWWLGALLLLWPAWRRLPIDGFVSLTRRFSFQALIVVGALVVAGAVLVLTLVNFGRPDWFTPYAQLLTLKIALAASALGLAAFNKLRLTPHLAEEDGRALRVLRQSIRLELAVIGCVLATTALLTTYTSPHT